MIYLYNHRPRTHARLKSISRLPKEEAFALAAELFADSNCEASHRFGPDEFPQYYETRIKAEAWLHDNFTARGGKPKTKHPLYFYVGDWDLAAKFWADCLTEKIPLDGIAVEDISFTFGDSCGAVDNPDKHYFFMLPELLELIAEHGGIEGLQKYVTDKIGYGMIEAHLWNDEYVHMQCVGAPFIAPDCVSGAINGIHVEILSKMLGATVSSANYETTQLQGGTVGNVRLISGNAVTQNGEIPFKVVQKVQKKWERWGDTSSWRREYDLYTSDLAETFTGKLRWPTCYHAEMHSNEETHLWLEYVEGVSGKNLTTEMLEKAAYELGRYQACGATFTAENLGSLNAVEEYYRHWKEKNVEYAYVRDENCPIPKHLRDMIIDIDNRADEIFAKIRKLPEVLCHRDFWLENIIFTDGKIILIDWDTTGYGYLCEDITQLITDETNPALWQEYAGRLIPAYIKGLGHNVEVTIIYEMILVRCGYLFVFHLMQDESPQYDNLQALYDVFYKFC